MGAAVPGGGTGAPILGIHDVGVRSYNMFDIGSAPNAHLCPYWAA
jgi:hypothetical protein